HINGNVLDFDAGILSRIENCGNILEIDGEVYSLNGHEPDSSVECKIESVEGKINEGTPYDQIVIGGKKYHRLIKEETSQQENEQPVPPESNRLEEALQAAAETPDKTADVPQTYSAEPTPEQIQGLAELIEKKEKEAYNKGKSELEGEVLAIRGELETAQGMMKDYKKKEDMIKVAEWLVAAMYAKGLDIIEDYETRFKAMEEMIGGYKENIESYNGQVTDLQNQITDVRKYAADSNKMHDEAEQTIVELESQRNLIQIERHRLEGVLETARNKYQELHTSYQEAIAYKEKFEKERNKLSDVQKEKFGIEEILLDLAGLPANGSFQEAIDKISGMVAEWSVYKEFIDSIEDEAAPQQEAIKKAAEHITQSKFDNAAEYVMTKVCQLKGGDLDKTENVLYSAFTGFRRIDPFDIGIEEKDLNILAEFYLKELEISGMSASGDDGAFASTLIEQKIRPSLSSLSDTTIRMARLKELEEHYKKYTPKPI
ncbi:hypothetical protein ACFL6I_29505, partial [candidate division KSB1 bacterium]